ncbi:MAG: hypothetical protein LBL86_06915 [Coriobacteriales bacterium]|jgi:hypothetical protein|nr:hypothetical protein [Coriobacteriales bacterium]
MTKPMWIGLSIEGIAIILAVACVVIQQPVPNFIVMLLITGMAISFAGALSACSKLSKLKQNEVENNDVKTSRFSFRKSELYTMLVAMIVLAIILTAVSLYPIML